MEEKKTKKVSKLWEWLTNDEPPLINPDFVSETEKKWIREIEEYKASLAI